MRRAHMTLPSVNLVVPLESCPKKTPPQTNHASMEPKRRNLGVIEKGNRAADQPRKHGAAAHVDVRCGVAPAEENVLKRQECGCRLDFGRRAWAGLDGGERGGGGAKGGG